MKEANSVIVRILRVHIKNNAEGKSPFAESDLFCGIFRFGVRVITEIDVAPYICWNVRVTTNCTAKRWITVMEVYTVLKSIFLWISLQYFWTQWFVKDCINQGCCSLFHWHHPCVVEVFSLIYKMKQRFSKIISLWLYNILCFV